MGLVSWYMSTIGSHAWWHEREQQRLNDEIPIDHDTPAEAHLLAANRYWQSYLKDKQEFWLSDVAFHANNALTKNPHATIDVDGYPVNAAHFAYLALYMEAYRNLNTCLSADGIDNDKLDQALRAIDKALSYRPDLADPWEVKARILFNHHRHKREARHFLNDALSRFPHHTGLLQVRDTFTR